MEIDKDLKKTLQFDPDKSSELLKRLLEVFQDQECKPTVEEILVTYGCLGYSLGASIEGYDTTGPDIEELKKEYYSNPKVGTALMLQGILVTTWLQDHKEQTKKEGQ